MKGADLSNGALLDCWGFGLFGEGGKGDCLWSGVRGGVMGVCE